MKKTLGITLLATLGLVTSHVLATSTRTEPDSGARELAPLTRANVARFTVSSEGSLVAPD